MNPESKLRRIVADLIDIPEPQITPELSLRVRKFNSSAGRAILRTALKKHLGMEVDIVNVGTFGDLLAAVNGAVPPVVASQPTSEAVAHTESNERNVPDTGFTKIAGCGVDLEDIATFPETADYWSHEFYLEHFTAEEIAYCVSQEFPRQHFAAMWCAKEALQKTADHYMRLSFSHIQVCHRGNGSTYIQQFQDGKWHSVPASLSLSHTDHLAVAFIVTQRD